MDRPSDITTKAEIVAQFKTLSIFSNTGDILDLCGLSPNTKQMLDFSRKDPRQFYDNG